MDTSKRPFLLHGILAVTVLAVLLGIVTSGGASSGLLFALLGLLLLIAAFIAILLWVIKKRTGSAYSPLFSVPAGTRKQVARALRDLRPPTGEAERQLALDEARRVRRLTPLSVPLMTLTSLLMLWGTYLQTIDDDRDLWQIGLNAASAVIFAVLVWYLLRTHHRCGVYLNRFAESGHPVQQP